MASISGIDMQAFYYRKFSDRKKKKLKAKKNILYVYMKNAYAFEIEVENSVEQPENSLVLNVH